MTDKQERLVKEVIADTPYGTAKGLLEDNYSWFSAEYVAKATGWSKKTTAGVMSGAQAAGLIDYDPEGGKYGWALTDKALHLAKGWY